MKQNPDQHRFKKDKEGFQIKSTDPVQDIMSDEELAKAEQKIQDLINQQTEEDNTSR